MTRDEYLDCVKRLTQWRRGDRRAPHKPLLILIALAEVQRDGDRLTPFLQIDEKLSPLLKQFGPPTAARQPKTEDPFRRLPKDRLWELIDRNGDAIEDPRVLTRGRLKSDQVCGGFPVEVRDLLRANASLVGDTVEILLEQNWPISYHDDIVEAVGISLDSANDEESTTQHLKKSVTRDPAFRKDVLMAYERMCAVCGFDLRLGDESLGLEAAHIKWHAFGGPDHIENGLALCSFHHKALDRGAFKLQPDEERFLIVVSQQINGNRLAKSMLTDFHGMRLKPPQLREYLPKKEFTSWHEREVFQGPAKTVEN